MRYTGSLWTQCNAPAGTLWTVKCQNVITVGGEDGLSLDQYALGKGQSYCSFPVRLISQRCNSAVNVDDEVQERVGARAIHEIR
jgi:hypothetical protein